MAESSRRIVKMKNSSPAKANGGGEGQGLRLDQLPVEVVSSIMTKLDVPSICAASITCKSFRICASQVLEFLPNFHLPEIAVSPDQLRRYLLPNPGLRSIRLDCRRLNDASTNCIVQPGLRELSLRNCSNFSGRLLSQIGLQCRELRSLYVSSVADNQGFGSLNISNLEDLLRGCAQLEALVLMCNVSMLLRPNFTRVWALASPVLTYLEIGFIPHLMFTELLRPAAARNHPPNQIPPPIMPNLQKLRLSVDYLSDTVVRAISASLVLLTHLDLRDQPIIEPDAEFDLTDEGLRLINQHERLISLSLIRSQELNPTFFRRVTDQGILFMAERSTNMESLCLGGFSQVTDTGFKTLLHSCTSLHELKVYNGTRMSDLVFHDMDATALTLNLVSLRRCNLLTDSAVKQLALNSDLSVLDLRDSRNIGDKTLLAVSRLPKLSTLLLDGTDITDAGLSYLQKGVSSTLVKLSVRGCSRLTDKCIYYLFKGGSNRGLRELDLSCLPNLSDDGVLLLVKNRIPLVDLRMRQCPQISNMSVTALASMTMPDEDRWYGSSFRYLDIFNCSGITERAFHWLRKPYFPGLRWLGMAGFLNEELARSLARNRPSLHLMIRGEELGTDKWDNLDDIYVHDNEELDELEQWIEEDEVMSEDNSQDEEHDPYFHDFDYEEDVEAEEEEEE